MNNTRLSEITKIEIDAILIDMLKIYITMPSGVNELNALVESTRNKIEEKICK